MKVDLYKRELSEIVCVGISKSGWVEISRLPSGHFEVEISEDEFYNATEEEVCTEIESAISDVRTDYTEQAERLRERYFGAEIRISRL